MTNFIKTKPKWFRDYLREPQNYFKHGNPKLKHGYHPRHVEVVMLDAIGVCNQLFGAVSPMMALFIAHSAIIGKVPKLLTSQMEGVLLKGGKIEEFRALNRKDFFQRAFPLLSNG